MLVAGKFAWVPHVKLPVKYLWYSGKFTCARRQCACVLREVLAASKQVNLPVITGKLHVTQVNCARDLFTCELHVKLPAFAGNFARASFTVWPWAVDGLLSFLLRRQVFDSHNLYARKCHYMPYMDRYCRFVLSQETISQCKFIPSSSWSSGRVVWKWRMFQATQCIPFLCDLAEDTLFSRNECREKRPDEPMKQRHFGSRVAEVIPGYLCMWASQELSWQQRIIFRKWRIEGARASTSLKFQFLNLWHFKLILN